MPLCNIEKSFARALGIFRVAAAANLRPASATGGGRSRDPQHTPRVVEISAAPKTKTALAEAKAVFVAGAVGIEPTTRGFGVDVDH